MEPSENDPHHYVAETRKSLRGSSYWILELVLVGALEPGLLLRNLNGKHTLALELETIHLLVPQ